MIQNKQIQNPGQERSSDAQLSIIRSTRIECNVIRRKAQEPLTVNHRGKLPGQLLTEPVLKVVSNLLHKLGASER